MLRAIRVTRPWGSPKRIRKLVYRNLGQAVASGTLGHANAPIDRFLSDCFTTASASAKTGSGTSGTYPIDSRAKV
jgi:hypothetical protein